MKKKLLIAWAVFCLFVSCTDKKVSFKGHVEGSNPEQRMELLDVTGEFSLPIANFGADEKGDVSALTEIPQAGVYALFHAGNMNLLYLKGGEEVSISEPKEKDGNSSGASLELSVLGKHSNNNVFLKASQLISQDFFTGLDSLMSASEEGFMEGIDKLNTSIWKKVDSLSTSSGADATLVKWRRSQFDIDILSLVLEYEKSFEIRNQGEKLSQKFFDFQKQIEGKGKPEELIKIPSYRGYLLNKVSSDFQKYLEKDSQKEKKEEASITSKFANFLKEEKTYSQSVRDRLITFVAMQLDLNPRNEDLEGTNKLLEDNVKDQSIKQDFYKVERAVFGLEKGAEAPRVKYVNPDGEEVSSSRFLGKPTVYLFYASWTYYLDGLIAELKDAISTYGEKLNFVFVNMDDHLDRFKKFDQEKMKEMGGIHLHARGGLNSKVAQKYALYGFNIPRFMLIDKDGKVEGGAFRSISDPELKESLDKLTGALKETEEAPAEQDPKSPSDEKKSLPDKKGE